MHPVPSTTNPGGRHPCRFLVSAQANKAAIHTWRWEQDALFFRCTVPEVCIHVKTDYLLSCSWHPLEQMLDLRFNSGTQPIAKVVKCTAVSDDGIFLAAGADHLCLCSHAA